MGPLLASTLSSTLSFTLTYLPPAPPGSPGFLAGNRGPYYSSTPSFTLTSVLKFGIGPHPHPLTPQPSFTLLPNVSPCRGGVLWLRSGPTIILLGSTPSSLSSQTFPLAGAASSGFDRAPPTSPTGA
ncbi:hypothetical protein HBI05_256820 [Parastagonospora nodorum]|nr:hypothetical protein HBI05_256820 [Parastagonospora nodorum]KAH5989746.1 hypothetical protein HBI83_259310 [Parastagonospora nodorum]